MRGPVAAVPGLRAQTHSSGSVGLVASVGVDIQTRDQTRLLYWEAGLSTSKVLSILNYDFSLYYAP